MDIIKTSSDPYSVTNRMRRSYAIEKANLRKAMQMKDPMLRDIALVGCSKMRAQLHRHLYGTTRLQPDFYTNVQGIPCGVVIEDDDGDFTLTNMRGYAVEWLEEKMERDDIGDLMQEMAQHISSARNDAAAHYWEGVADDRKMGLA